MGERVCSLQEVSSVSCEGQAYQMGETVCTSVHSLIKC